ncbi:hypothetical protein DFP72DRAFT_904794 [Ephemerocybe angulata]|uniref:VWFA domain-containing protein n=1 Tax=Ephemerocybe angulata TaxID=980116 RepID=A0A8H6HV81_9AGAR|nr:hypothetical protein DFP72DRAFT_904794 [Tulosesus angulatus]
MSQHSSSSKGKGKVSNFLSTVFKSDKGKSLYSNLPIPAHSDGPPSYEQTIAPEELAALAAYDTIFLVDDSGSMGHPVNSSNKRGKTRWQKASDCVIKYANIAARYDADGVDIYFLNRTTFPVSNCNTQLTTEAEIANLFRLVTPYGGTPLGRRLRELPEEDEERMKLSKELGTLFKAKELYYHYRWRTCGRPTADREAEVAASIKRIAELLDDLRMPLNQLGFQFVQVGDDRMATMFLEALDGGIEGVSRDIVDTVKTSDLPSSEDDYAFVTKLLLGGIDRFHDRRVAKAKQAVNKRYVPQIILPGK